jgi:hypothetical protein
MVLYPNENFVLTYTIGAGNPISGFINIQGFGLPGDKWRRI